MSVSLLLFLFFCLSWLFFLACGSGMSLVYFPVTLQISPPSPHLFAGLFLVSDSVSSAGLIVPFPHCCTSTCVAPWVSVCGCFWSHFYSDMYICTKVCSNTTSKWIFSVCIWACTCHLSLMDAANICVCFCACFYVCAGVWNPSPEHLFLIKAFMDVR